MNAVLDGNSTFYEWGEKFLHKKKNKVSVSQYKNLKCYIAHAYRFFGQTPIIEVGKDNVDDLMDNLTEENPNTGKPASHQYLVDVRRVVFDVFDLAIDEDVLMKNPARKVEISKFAPTEELRALTLYEQRCIISTRHRARLGAQIMMLVGPRKGELIPLTWDDFDLTNLQVNLTKSVEEKYVNQYVVKRGTKTQKWGRKNPLPLELAIELEEAKKYATSPFVCPNAEGGMHTPSSWERMWESYIREILRQNPFARSTEIETVTAQNLRHTYATLLYISGVKLIEASKLLGHSNIKTTANIYTHLDELMIEKSIEPLETYVSKNLYAQEEIRLLA